MLDVDITTVIVTNDTIPGILRMIRSGVADIISFGISVKTTLIQL